MAGEASPDRPGEAPVPEYRWVPGKPDPRHHHSTGGCFGCAFRKMPEVRCSRIPCQTRPGMVAELIPLSSTATQENRNGSTQAED